MRNRYRSSRGVLAETRKGMAIWEANRISNQSQHCLKRPVPDSPADDSLPSFTRWGFTDPCKRRQSVRFLTDRASCNKGNGTASNVQSGNRSMSLRGGSAR